jgi:hypothetical protein
MSLRAGVETEAKEKSYSSVGDRTPVVQSVVRHYNDRATSVLETGKALLNKQLIIIIIIIN